MRSQVSETRNINAAARNVVSLFYILIE
jgi:hypothetical protein